VPGVVPRAGGRAHGSRYPGHYGGCPYRIRHGYLFGIRLLAGGAVQAVIACLGCSWRGFFLHLLDGILQPGTGEPATEPPGMAAEWLPLLLPVTEPVALPPGLLI
jgi:hypothetical protein